MARITKNTTVTRMKNGWDDKQEPGQDETKNPPDNRFFLASFGWPAWSAVPELLSDTLKLLYGGQYWMVRCVD